MKLSSHALSFLLAQYRAIFKRAYVSGLASAILLTTALASTSAQAEVYLYTQSINNALNVTNQYEIVTGATNADNKQYNVDYFEQTLANITAGKFDGLDTSLATGIASGIFHSSTAKLEGNMNFFNVAGAVNRAEGKLTTTASGGNLTIGGTDADIDGNIIRTHFKFPDTTRQDQSYDDDLGGSAFGGMALNSGDAFATSNTLTVQADKYADAANVGGYALSVSGDASSTKNVLNYTSSKVVQGIDTSAISKTLAGGYARINAASGTMTVADNTLNLGSASNSSATDIKAKEYFAGGFGRFSPQDKAGITGTLAISNNSANLTNVTLSSTDAKYIVGGGTDAGAGSASMTGNKVVLNDVTISGDKIIIAGAYDKTGITGLTATNNSVTVGADSVITDASIYSTYSKNGYYASESGGQIQIDGTYKVSASQTATLAAKEVEISGELNNAGTLNVTGHLNSNEATIHNSGTLNLANDASLATIAELTNTGTINVTDSGLRLETISNLLEAKDAKINLIASAVDKYAHISLEEEDVVDLTSEKLTHSNSGNFAFHAESAQVTVGTDNSGYYRVSVDRFIGKTDEDSAGIYTIASGDLVYAMSSFNLSSADTKGAKNLNVSGSLVLGSNADFVANSGYEVTELDGAGRFNNVNVTLNDDNAKVKFMAGSWSDVGAVTVTKGDFSVIEGADVTVKSLGASAKDDVIVEGASLSAADLAMSGAEASTVDVSSNSTFTTALDNVIDYTAAAGEVKESITTDSKKFASGAIDLDGTSTIRLTGAKALLGTDTITLDQFKAIKDAIIGQNGMGTVSFDSVSVGLDPEIEAAGEISADAAADYAGSDALKNITVTGVTSSAVSGTNTWGSVELAQGTTTVSVAEGSALNLTQASSGNFVTTADGQVGGISLTGDQAQVSLANGGTIADITGSANADQQVVIAGNGNTTTIGTISNVNTVTLQNGAVTVGAIEDVENLATTSSPITAQGDITVGNLSLDSALTSELSSDEPEATRFNVTAESLEMKEGASLTTNKLTLGASSDPVQNRDQVSSTLTGQVTAQEIEVARGADNIISIVDATVTAESLTFTGDSGILSVGQAQGEEQESAGGSLHLTTLDLNGGMLLLDPDYGSAAAFTTVIGADTEDFVSTAGSVGVGQNSVFVSGMAKDEAQSLLAKLGLTNSEGSLSRNNVGSAVVLNKSYHIARGAALYLNADGKIDGVNDSLYTNVNALVNSLGGSGGAVELGENTALVVTQSFTDKASELYLLEFADATNASVTLAENSKIIFDSTALVAGDQVKLTNTTNVTDSGTVISTAGGGLLTGSIVSDTNESLISFSFNRGAERLLTQQSDPVKDMTVTVLKNENGAYDSTDAGVAFIAATGAHNGGRDTETAARFALYGGAAQAALMAQNSVNEAVSERVGSAQPSSGLIAADNGQGAGLWINPVYKSSDLDGFEAQGLDYGADIDLYGVALGGDFTFGPNVRVGAAFHIGAGDADGEGVGSGASNDFDYYGFSLYAGTSFGNFAVGADFGFTQVSNELEQSAYLGKLSADTDAQVLTLGVRGEYLLSSDVANITPHVGLRYTSLDVDDYSVKCDATTIAHNDSDRMNVFSLPVGVTIAKDITAGAWTVAPQFDLTLTANMGDDELESSTEFVGVEAVGLATEVLDSFTYGAKLGLKAQYQESFSFGLNVGYVGSSNSDEFGVNANARFSF